MESLKRELAPMVSEAWRLVDLEAARVLRLNLGGRKLVDVSTPLGWDAAGVNTGRLALLEGRFVPEVSVGIRQVLPMIELRSAFQLEIAELDGVTRGAKNPDLGPIVKAAERISRAEDRVVFEGVPAAGIRGMLSASPHEAVTVASIGQLSQAVLRCREVLRVAGVGGPYCLALGHSVYDELFAARDDGFPLIEQIEKLVDGRVVLAPSLEGAAFVSLASGSYQLTLGQDLSVGYGGHDKRHVELYLVESFTFEVLDPQAVVRLRRS